MNPSDGTGRQAGMIQTLKPFGITENLIILLSAEQLNNNVAALKEFLICKKALRHDSLNHGLFYQ